jgi:hypothetical protein
MMKQVERMAMEEANLRLSMVLAMKVETTTPNPK